jgi:hypothetical protein
MIGAAPLVSETALAAHRRRVAFRASIAAKAARLKEQRDGAHQPRDAAPEAVAAQPDPPAPAEPGSMKEPWFYIEQITAKRVISVREIQMAVCRHYGFTFDQLNAARRTRPVVRARQVAFYLCRELTLHSLPAIGRRFAGKDHTTVLHGCRAIDALILSEPIIAGDLAKLRAELEAML